jgi:DNA-binding GntR family transcriptional regulator
MRLQPERALAPAISVGRGTVVAAYRLLCERGMAERQQGSGTWVTTPGDDLARAGELCAVRRPKGVSVQLGWGT